MISLNNFENSVPYKILQRGEDYYASELVSDLEETEPGEWEAIVSGTEDYAVDISMDGDELVFWDCDCPYDGEICKHVVATLLAIRDYRSKVEHSAFSKQQTEAEEAIIPEETFVLDCLDSELQQLLSLAKPNELLQFISGYASANEEFKKALLQYLIKKYLKPTAQEKAYRAEIQRAFNPSRQGGKSRYHRYHDDFDWEAIFDQVEIWLKKAGLLVKSGNPDGAVSIALQILHSIGENYDDDLLYNDDIYVSDYCEQAGDLILKIIRQPELPRNLKDNVLQELCQIARLATYADYDIYDVDELIMQVNILIQPAGKSLELIDSLLEERKDSYDLYKLVFSKIELLTEQNQQDKADEVIRQYLYLDKVREMEVEKRIKENRYEEALRLLDDGLELSHKKGHVGTTKKWLELKLQIYKKLGDTASVITICRQLFVHNRGNMEYYHQLKQLVPASQWSGFLNEMMGETTFESPFAWAGDVEADIYVEERDTDRLFELLSSVKYNRLKVLMKYAHHLKNTHSQQLVAIFISELTAYAEQNMGRNHYEFIAGVLSCMQKMNGGEEAVKHLVAEFRVIYKRRPAMMEELGKF